MTRRRSEQTPLVVVTPDERPLARFGSRASDAVAELLRRRRIEVMTGARVREDDDGRVEVALPHEWHGRPMAPDA